MTIATIEQRRLGAFWGLATGDALGAPIEFYPRDRLPEIREMTGGGSSISHQAHGRMILRWLYAWDTV